MVMTMKAQASRLTGAMHDALVPVAPVARLSILMLLFVYTATIVVLGLSVREYSLESYLLALSQLALGAVSAYPLLVPGLCQWGNPLFLGSLLFLVNSLLKGTAVNVFGMHSHSALPAYSIAELTQLLAYRNVLVTISLIALYLGYHLNARAKVPMLAEPILPKPVRVVLLSSLVALVGLFFLVEVSGDIGEHLSNLFRPEMVRVYAESPQGLGMYALFIHFGFVGMVVWIASDRRPTMMPAQAVGALLSIVGLFLISGRRSSVVLPIVVFLLLLALRQRRVPGLLASALLAPLLVFAGVVANLRTTILETGSLFDSSIDRPLSAYFSDAVQEMESRASDNSSALAIYALVPHEHDLLYGMGYFGHFTKFIPRAWWSSKPLGVDFLAGETFFGVTWSIPPGALGEAYWNFHIPGIIFVFVAFGALQRWLVNFVRSNPDHAGALSIYVVTVLIFNPSQTGFTVWFMMIVPLLFLLRIGGLLQLSRSRTLKTRK